MAVRSSDVRGLPPFLRSELLRTRCEETKSGDWNRNCDNGGDDKFDEDELTGNFWVMSGFPIMRRVFPAIGLVVV